MSIFTLTNLENKDPDQKHLNLMVSMSEIAQVKCLKLSYLRKGAICCLTQNSVWLCV